MSKELTFDLSETEPVAVTPVSFDLADTEPVNTPEMSEYTPTWGDTLNSVLDTIGLDSTAQRRGLAGVELTARDMAARDNQSVDRVYEEMGGSRPMLNPEGRPPSQVAPEVASLLATEGSKIPQGFAKASLQAIRGGVVPAKDESLGDRWIADLSQDRKRKVDPNYDKLSGLGESTGYSLATMGASALAGLGATALTGSPVAGYAAGMAASGGVAYRGQKNDFLRRARDKLNEERELNDQAPMTQAEWAKEAERIDWDATKYGLWEAGPESVGNMAFLRALRGLTPGKAMLASAPVEHGTETATALGQNQAEIGAGLAKEEMNIRDAFRSQFFQTMALSALMGGGAKAMDVASKMRAGRQAPTATGETASTTDKPQPTGPIGRAAERATTPGPGGESATRESIRQSLMAELDGLDPTSEEFQSKRQEIVQKLDAFDAGDRAPVTASPGEPTPAPIIDRFAIDRQLGTPAPVIDNNAIRSALDWQAQNPNKTMPDDVWAQVNQALPGVTEGQWRDMTYRQEMAKGEANMDRYSFANRLERAKGYGDVERTGQLSQEELAWRQPTLETPMQRAMREALKGGLTQTPNATTTTKTKPQPAAPNAAGGATEVATPAPSGTPPTSGVNQPKVKSNGQKRRRQEEVLDGSGATASAEPPPYRPVTGGEPVGTGSDAPSEQVGTGPETPAEPVGDGPASSPEPAPPLTNGLLTPEQESSVVDALKKSRNPPASYLRGRFGPGLYAKLVKDGADQRLMEAAGLKVAAKAPAPAETPPAQDAAGPVAATQTPSTNTQPSAPPGTEAKKISLTPAELKADTKLDQTVSYAVATADSFMDRKETLSAPEFAERLRQRVSQNDPRNRAVTAAVDKLGPDWTISRGFDNGITISHVPTGTSTTQEPIGPTAKNRRLARKQSQAQPVETPPVTSPKPLTQEAQDLLATLDQPGKGASVPLTITRNLRKIAEANGITVTDEMKASGKPGAQAVVDALRAKQAPAPVEPAPAATAPPSFAPGDRVTNGHGQGGKVVLRNNVQMVQPDTKPGEDRSKPVPATADTKNAFTMNRIGLDGMFAPLTFERGETVKVSGKRPFETGIIEGISRAKKQAKVNGVWTDFSHIYKDDYDEFALARKNLDADVARMSERLDAGNTIDFFRILDNAKAVAGREGLASEYDPKFLELENRRHDIAVEDYKQQTNPQQLEPAPVSNKPRTVVRMTMEEWKKTNRNFKGKDDQGGRTVLYGGALYPVEIVKDQAQSSHGVAIEVDAETPPSAPTAPVDAKPSEPSPAPVASTTPAEATQDAQDAKKAATMNAARERAMKARAIDPTKDDLLAAIAKMGGLSLSEAEQQGIDVTPGTVTRSLRGSGILRVFTKNGMAFDGMAEALAQHGYPVTDAQGNYTQNALLDSLTRALSGARVLAKQGAETEVERLAANRDLVLKDQESDVPFGLIDAIVEHPTSTKTETTAKAAELRKLGIEAMGEDAYDDLLEQVAKVSEDLKLNDAEHLELLEDKITHARDRQTGQAPVRGSAESGAADAGSEPFALTGQASDEIARAYDIIKQREADEAARLKAEEAKRQIDAGVDGFGLSVVETNPNAQKAADQGQKGFNFDAPVAVHSGQGEAEGTADQKPAEPTTDTRPTEDQSGYIPVPTLADLQVVDLGVRDSFTKKIPDDVRGKVQLRLDTGDGVITVGELINTRKQYGNDSEKIWETSDGTRFAKQRDAKQHEFETHVIPTLRSQGYLAPASDPRFSIAPTSRVQDGTQPAGLSVAQTQAIVDQARSGWLGKTDGRLPIRVIQTQAEALGEGSVGRDGRAKGFIRGGEVYLVADHLESEKDARRVLAHEVIGHYGLDLMGDQARADFLRMIKDAARKNYTLRKRWDQEKARNPKLDEAGIAEEVFAKAIEAGRSKLGQTWDRIMTWLRDTLRALGIIEAGHISPAELRLFAQDLARAIRAGAAEKSLPLGSRFALSPKRIAEMDKDYLAAVERGDMETAQKLVKEAAQAKGYGETDHRMQHAAPDRGDTNLLDIKTSGLVPDDYWTNPKIYQGMAEEMESWQKVNRALDRQAAREANRPPVRLTVYRAVPKGVKEERFRNGDWVTPSLSYAQNEGGMISGGYRIMTLNVPITQLWWDGNSIAELGFDDGQGYVYRNTKNNRKRLDPVTYDDNGQVIPLSKRFNLRVDDPRFMFAGQAAKTADGQEMASAPRPENADSTSLPPTIEVDGVQRPTTNSEGRPIHSTEEGVRNFWRWFGDSKVVDQDGKPLMVYHGTRDDFSQFNIDKESASGHDFSALGLWFSDSRRIANNNAPTEVWGEPVSGANVMPAYLHIVDPTRIDYDDMLNKGKRSIRNIKNRAVNSNSDGFFVGRYGGKDGFDFVAFDPKQIKSAIGNTGSFSPTTPDIRFSLTTENEAIRTGNRKFWNKAKSLLRRQLAPGGNLPQSTFDQQIQKNNQDNVLEMDIKNLLKHFDANVKAAYQLPYGKLPDATKELLDQAIRFEDTAFMDASIPEPVKLRVLAMRQYVDGLSTEFQTILFDEAEQLLREGKDEMAAQRLALLTTIASHMGKYIHRSYQVFDDPKWIDKVTRNEQVMADARRYLTERGEEKAQQYDEWADKAEAKGETDLAERHRERAAYHRDPYVINKTIRLILTEGKAFETMGEFALGANLGNVKESKLGAMDMSVLMRKKEIAPEIRALMGEYTDPRLNFARSATKMGRLIHNNKFLKEVLNSGEGVFLFKDPKTAPMDVTTQIATSKNYAPLAGYYTTPEIKQAFEDAMDKPVFNDVYRVWLAFNSLVKIGQTVASVSTQVHNFVSNLGQVLNSGHFNLSHGKTAFKAWKEYRTGMDDGKFFQYLRHLREIGVHYDSAYASEMMELIKDARGGAWLDQDTGSFLSNAWGFAQMAYRYGDDFWKIIGFENEKALQDKYYPHLSAEEIEARAAKRIRDTYQTYSMVGRAVQNLRRFPILASFPSFTSEVIRTSVNSVRLLGDEASDPKTRWLAARRFVGMVMAHGMYYGLAAFAASLLGIGDDERKAAQKLAPRWQKNATVLPLYRDADGTLHQMDLSYIDFYGYFHKTLNAMWRGEDWEQKLTQIADELTKPFLDYDIAFGAFMEAYVKNQKQSGGPVYYPSDGVIQREMAKAGHVAYGVLPAPVKGLYRLWQAANDKLSPSGVPYSKLDESLAFVGFRQSPFNPRNALYYKAEEFSRNIRDASRIFNRVAADLNPVSPDELAAARSRAKQAHDRLFKDLIDISSAAVKSGMPKGAVRQTLDKAGLSESDARSVVFGRIPPFQTTDSAFERTETKSKLIKAPVTMQQFRERRVWANKANAEERRAAASGAK